jgi:hypothetical protein
MRGHSAELPQDSQHFGWVRSLEVVVTDVTPSQRVTRLVGAAEYDDLVKLICPIANRCLRAIRNAGMVPEVHEVFPGWWR